MMCIIAASKVIIRNYELEKYLAKIFYSVRKSSIFIFIRKNAYENFAP